MMQGKFSENNTVICWNRKAYDLGRDVLLKKPAVAEEVEVDLSGTT